MKKTTHRLLALLCFIAFSVVLHAQQKKTVTGVVRDNTGVGLAGATVTEKGTSNRVLSDQNGNYSINVSPQATLTISYIGFTTQEVQVNNQETVSVALEASGNAMNEIVVTGFGMRKQARKVTYSIQTVDADELSRANTPNLVNALQGKVAGVMITQGAGGPSSSSRIRIRGNASLSPNTQPLFVIDGVLIKPGTTGADSWGTNQDFGNIVKNLNPDDYESVTILKGSAASSLYGSEGLNGVVLITTKKGRPQKGLGVTVSHTEAFDKAYKFYDQQSEYGGGISPVFAKDNGVDVVDKDWAPYYSFGPKLNGQMVKDIDGRMVKWEAHDPLDFFKTGKYINTNVALEGGNEKTTFRFSFSNLYNSSVFPNNSLKRNNFTLRATQKLSKAINIDAGVTYTTGNTKNPVRQGGNNTALFQFSYYMPRNVDFLYWRDNYLDTELGGRKRGATKDPYHISSFMFELDNDNATRVENTLRANVDLTANLTSWLNLLVRSNISTFGYQDERSVLGSNPGFVGGSYSVGLSSSRQYRIQGLLNANRTFANDFELNVSAGGETDRDLGGQNSFTSTSGGLKIPGKFALSNSINALSAGAGITAKTRTDALYMYGDLTWKNMLTLNFSGRNDWSSTLTYADGHGSNTYFYPSVGLAWVFTELPSLQTSGVLSFGKLRASLGYTGSPTDPWRTNQTGYYGLAGNYDGVYGGLQPVYTFNGSTLGNQNLKNRLAREIEIGADVRFLNNRLGLDVSVYKKNAFNEILELNLPPASGVTSRLINAGNIQNKGIEILLNAQPIKNKNLNWNTTFNFSRNWNKIIELIPGQDSKELELAFGADVKSVALVGGEYGTIQTSYAFAYYQKKDANGNPISHPSNGQKVIGGVGGANGLTYLRSGTYDGTTRTLGSMMEKYLLSNINSVQYKDFSLNVQVDAKIGGLMASATHQYGTSGGQLANSLFGRDKEHGGVEYTDDNGVKQYDGIIPEGVFADGVKVNVGGTEIDLGGMSWAEAIQKGYMKPKPAWAYYEDLTQWSSGIREYSIFENSFVALREVSIGYNLPSRFIQKAKINNLRVSLTGRNLLYLYKTAKDGINPEGIFSNRAGVFAEYGGVPYIRNIGVTVNANF